MHNAHPVLVYLDSVKKLETNVEKQEKAVFVESF
jgi:hypothetical protein